MAVSFLLPGLSPPASGISATAAIAEATFALSGVRRRPVAALVWNDLGVGNVIHESDTIFVPADSTATVRFQDGARMTLAPGSMVTLRLNHTAPEISIARGQLAVSSTEGGLLIRGTGGVVALNADSDARVSVAANNTSVELASGRARVEGNGASTPLLEGQGGSVNAAGEVTPASTMAHALASPRFGQNVFYVRQPPAVRLVWSKPAEHGVRLEISRDGFASIESRVAVTGTTQPFRATRGGVFWWRLVDESGTPTSGSSMFVLTENQPPALNAPPRGATVSVPPGDPVRFHWSEVPGARAYEVEIADREDFAEPVLTATLETNRFTTRTALDDGRYFWRVRVADVERGFSPHSAPESFWLVHRTILDAPGELEVEVEKSAGARP